MASYGEEEEEEVYTEMAYWSSCPVLVTMVALPWRMVLLQPITSSMWWSSFQYCSLGPFWREGGRERGEVRERERERDDRC